MTTPPQVSTVADERRDAAPPPVAVDAADPPVEATEAADPTAEAADPRLMAHAYDGIREYDNPLPGWWNLIFIATIIFSVGYGIYYHLGRWGSTPDERYRAALAVHQEKRVLRDQAEAAAASEETLARRALDPKSLAEGQAIFVARCTGCHTENGRGLIGPNLTDDYQLHGETRMDIYNTIRRGVPGTSMLAWGEQLPPAEVLAVASYVSTLRHTNVPSGKSREGNRVAPFAP